MTEINSAPSSSPWKSAFAGRGFLLVVVVLAVAAVGLNAAARGLQLVFKKHPVPLRHRLDDVQAGVPREMGPWVSVHQTSTLDEDVQHSLGTRDFVFRTYVDRRIAGKDVVERLVTLGREIDGLDEQDKAQLELKRSKQREWYGILRRIQADRPEAVMALAVTFYTGMVDTVAHVPDVCMVADGYQPKNPTKLSVAAGEYPDGSPRQVEMQFTTFEDQTGHGRVARNVAYLFHCNGGYEPSHVGVRGKLQNLFERHGYYAKVELMTDEPARSDVRLAKNEAGTARAVAAMTDLLSVALPEVERCLPDWDEVKGGKTAVAAQ